MASKKTIARLSMYRRLLEREVARGTRHVCSYHLAEETGVSAAQVRRDIMLLGYTGSPNRGYDTLELQRSIADYLDDPRGQRVALVGLGNLGCAVLTFVSQHRPSLSIVAAFDRDCEKVGQAIAGCMCRPLEDLERLVREHEINLGVIAVPVAEAQDAADRLVRAGVTGLVNFAPTTLELPDHVYVERPDLITSLERAAFFARRERVS